MMPKLEGSKQTNGPFCRSPFYVFAFCHNLPKGFKFLVHVYGLYTNVTSKLIE